jgi:hypothetical protein
MFYLEGRRAGKDQPLEWRHTPGGAGSIWGFAASLASGVTLRRQILPMP